jgi:hypothetical protein
MQSAIQNTTNTLKDTTGRVNKLISESGGSPICYLILFITFVFLLLYYLAVK